MRVLHVMAGGRRRGAQSRLTPSALALSEAGLSQQVMVSPNDLECRAALVEGGVSIVDAPARRDTCRQAIVRAIAQFSPDVLHFWSSEAAMCAPRQSAQRSLGWHAGRQKLSAFRHCHWHAAANADLARSLVAQGVAPGRVSVMAAYAPIAPRTECAPRAALRTPDAAVVTLAIARAFSRAGLEALIKAHSALPGLYLWIAGEGAGGDAVRDAAEKHGALERIRFADRALSIDALLGACDIVAFPARGDHERELVAAWALGKPVLRAATACAGAKLDADGASVLAHWGDAPALREGLRLLLEDGAIAKGVAESGRRLYEARFTKAAFVRSAMALYDRIRSSEDRVTRT